MTTDLATAVLMPTTACRSARAEAFLARLHVTLLRHGCGPDFGPAELARELAMSERQLQRKLKALLARSPRDLLRGWRLQRAAQLLSLGLPAGVVAVDVGFSSASWFGACFREHFGRTPGEYQRDSLAAREIPARPQAHAARRGHHVSSNRQPRMNASLARAPWPMRRASDWIKSAVLLRSNSPG